MVKKLGIVLAALLAGPLVGCGGGSSGGEPAPAPSAVASSAATSSTPTPTPTPAAASADEDYAALKKAAIDAADVGKDWKRQGELQDLTPSHRKDQGTPKPVEYCPGHVSQAFAKNNYQAALSQTFTKKVTQVTKTTRTISDATLSVSSSTLATPEAGELRDGFAADLKACHDFKVSDDLYAVLTPAGPETHPGADEVITSFSAFRYSDKKHKNLIGIGQYVYVRSGRVVTSVVLNSLPTKDNGDGKDFAGVNDVLGQQLKANAAAIPS